ncbi:MAG: tetratricopeptide repeat protein [Deltaproteobacteria bacterium]|nr:MAG: tetratricopeptide repeat protein [Deltaproteobacteria bacterium]
MQIPGWIVDQDTLGHRGGTLQGATMFVDISGFTALTGKLMSHGKEGAEILAGTLRFYFDPLVESVSQAGGLIAGFAGDAFTAVFPEQDDLDVAEYTLQAALSMQEFFRQHAVYRNAFGEFPFALKIGLSWGSVEWGVIETSEHMATYFFRGPGVDDCARAEHFADKGMIVADSSFLHHVPLAVVDVVDDGMFLCKGTQSPPLRPLPFPSFQGDQGRFLHPGISSFPSMGEFRRVVAVFFSFENVEDLEALAQQVQSGLDMYGGLLTRFDFGDKGCNALIFFGVPVGYENETDRALDFVLSFAQTCPESLLWRAGITRDVTYAGFNGGTRRNEFTCLGRAVNLAARLMMKAGWGEIWCDPNIVERAEARYKMEHVGAFPLKGFTHDVDIYKLLHKRVVLEEQFAAQAMVGRETEVLQLHECIATAIQGSFSGFCYVDGEPGMGKSYLVDSYRRELSAAQPEGSFLWVYAPCDQTLLHSLHPLSYALRTYFHQSPTQSKEENWNAFGKAYRLLLKRLPLGAYKLQQELVRVESFLAALVGLRKEGSLYEQLDPKLRFENTLSAICSWVEAESLNHPVVLQIEDGQWLDDDSQKALLRIASMESNPSLAVVLTCRYLDDGSPFRLPVDASVSQTVINLNQLTERGLRQLVENQLGGTADPALLALVADKSRGNPFFAEQIVRYLQENQGLEQGEHGLTPVTTGVILPDEVNAVLVARLDRLANEIKQIVQVASVLGQQFDVQILSHTITRLNEEELRASQDSLEQVNDLSLEDFSPPISAGVDTSVDFVPQSLERGIKLAEEEQIWAIADELHYLFRHALLRDAAYDMQARARLRQLHRFAGFSFETAYSDELEPYLGEVAYHFDKAEQRDEAIFYLEKAGDLARQNYHNSEAMAYYKRLLELEPDNPEQIGRVSLSLAKVLQLLTRLDEGLEFCRMAEAAVEKPSPEIRYQQAILLMMQGRLKEAQDIAAQALEMARGLGDVHWEATSLIGLGGLLLYSGDIDTAWKNFETSLTLSQSIGKPELEAKALNNMAGVASKRGDRKLALDLLKRSLVLKQQCTDRWGEVITLGNLGELHLDLNEPEIALEYLQDAQRKCEELGSKHPPFLLHCSEALRRLGHIDDAWETIQEGQQRAANFKNPKYISLGALFAGHILRDKLQLDEARGQYQLAKQWAEKRKLQSFLKEAEQALHALEHNQPISISFPK